MPIHPGITIRVGDTVQIPVPMTLSEIVNQTGRVIEIKDIGSPQTGVLLIVRCGNNPKTPERYEWECNATLVN